MKLRTRLTLIAGAVILFSMMLGGGVIFQMYRNTMLDQAEQTARQESERVFQDMMAYREQFPQELDAEQAAYYLKSQGDDYTILLHQGVPVYNQTVLDARDLYRKAVEANGAYRCLLAGRRLLVFSFGWEKVTLLHIVDVTDTYLNIYRLARDIVLVSLGVVLAAGLSLFVLLRRSLRPLQDLSEGTNAIAAGAYGRRVPEASPDEIGDLGRDFNKMAQAVEEHIREVEESEEKKTLFMGSLTHELKTPLTAISGYAQTLRHVKLSEEDRETALDYIYQESKRLDRLSKKMLRLLELDQETELTLETVPIRQLLEEARRVCLPGAREKGVQLEMGPCEGQLNADFDLMTDVIVNLVDNAVKASPTENVVRLSARNGVILVEDEGSGIPPEELDRLTEPFYMVDKSRSRKSGGAGLGLALAAVILRRHGMALRMESELGKGTKVYVE